MKRLLLDPHWRTVDSILSKADLDQLGTVVDIVWGKDEIAPQEVVREAKLDVAFIATGSWRHGAVSRRDAPSLEAIIEVSGGHFAPSEFDYPTCFGRGIRVLSCKPAFAAHVAELALGHAITIGRGIVDADRSLKSGGVEWGYARASSLYGARVGLIGYGNLGRSLMKLLVPFGCVVSVFDPGLADAYLAGEGMKPVTVDEVLSTSDFVFVLASPSDRNRGFLSRSHLERVKAGATFLLISRSSLVDFDALIELADAGRFHAGIDVFPEEPLPADHAARTARNVVLTPHIAGPPGRREIGRMIVEDVTAMAEGRPPANLEPAPLTFARDSPA